MKKSLLVKIPAAVLWQFRAFKRDKVPVVEMSFMPSYTVEEATDYFDPHGIVEPVELSIIGNRALLTGGNHRIGAAQRLGLKMIPVQLVIFFGGYTTPFDDHTLQKFRPISRHLELWLKRIFI